MTAVTLRRGGAALTMVVALGLVVPAVGVTIRRGELLGLFPPDLGASVVFATVGSFLLLRGAVTRIAVIMCVQGVGAGATTALGVWTQLAVQAGPLRGVSLWMAWANDFVWLPGVVLLTPLVLLFPDGRLASPRWRWPIRAAAGVAAVFVLSAFSARTGLIDGRPYAFAPNPTGFIDLLPAVADVVGTLGLLGLVACLFVSLGALIARRRHAVGVERAQLTSLLYGGALSVTLLVSLESVPNDVWWVFAIELFAVAPIAAGIAVAVLRYRLYEIDKVVSRTVAYALVLAVLAAVYVGVFAGLSRLIPSRYGHVGVAAATLLVSILAVPLTRRVRRLVDHRFNRSRFDADRVAAAFASRLRARPERGDIPADLLDVVTRTVAPTHAGVWLVGGSRQS